MHNIASSKEMISKTLSYDVEGFCRKYKLNSADQSLLLSRLMYAIYYERLTQASFVDKTDEYKECYLIASLAEFLSDPKLKKILKALPERLTLALIHFCGFSLQEGPWKAMKILRTIYAKDKEWMQLLVNIRQKYYDIYHLEEVLHGSSKIKLKSVLKALEQRAQEQIQEIHALLPFLLDLLITHPLRSGLANAGQAQIDLAYLFAKHRKQSYSIEEIEQFFRLFGLHDFYTTMAFTTQDLSDILLILQGIADFLKNPAPIAQESLKIITDYLLSLFQKLFALHREPAQYQQGLDSIVYALPTRGNNLLESPWLAAVIEGLKAISKRVSAKVSTCPIVIFDQSSAKQFKKNHDELQKLAKREKLSLWHVSNTQAIELAKKLRVQQWIPLSLQENFGYAASRNCVYLLAPVLQEATKQGIKSIPALLKMRPSLLRKYFDKRTLGQDGNDAVIGMGEDDADILPCNFFADALFAFLHKNTYFQRESYVIGRSTWYANPYLDPASVLAAPIKTTSQTTWDYKPRIHGSIGLLTKPRFCLPTYFGSEEQQVSLKDAFFETVQQCPIHLAGARFPAKLFPNSALDGLEEYLSKVLPYVIQIGFIICLIDPKNEMGRCILPWNNLDLQRVRPFKNLGDLWGFALSNKVINKIREGFWKNLADFADDDVALDAMAKRMPIREDIDRLVHADLSLEMPEALRKFYENIQIDACMLMALVRDLLRSRSLKTSIKTVEKAFGLKIKQTQLTKDLVSLILLIENFEKNQTQL